MKIVNAATGKIGAYFVGPKQYLKENIRLGEIMLCVGRDDKCAGRPCIWVVGGVEQLIDFVSLAVSNGEITQDIGNTLLARIDDAKTKTPKTPLERLASVLGSDIDELKEIIDLSQVCISAPISGIHDYSDLPPKWIAKSASYAPIH